MAEPKKPFSQFKRDHLANERTFLAWIRTSLGIIVLGFVVVKFNLFLKRIAFALHISTLPPSHGITSTIGIFLVCFGALLSLLAFIHFTKVRKQIDTDTYRPLYSLSLALTIIILLSGIFLAVYLANSSK